MVLRHLLATFGLRWSSSPRALNFAPFPQPELADSPPRGPAGFGVHHSACILQPGQYSVLLPRIWACKPTLLPLRTETLFGLTPVTPAPRVVGAFFGSQWSLRGSGDSLPPPSLAITLPAPSLLTPSTLLSYATASFKSGNTRIAFCGVRSNSYLMGDRRMAPARKTEPS